MQTVKGSKPGIATASVCDETMMRLSATVGQVWAAVLPEEDMQCASIYAAYMSCQYEPRRCEVMQQLICIKLCKVCASDA